ncbi:MAG: WbqC family protein, partial [Flavobacterium sp.]|nr:WbqC family protein [Flavobacterium sp.]
NIPVKHSKIAHQKTKDIQIENDFDWQKQHFKSLEAAYRSSPFFEYFEDDLLPIFEKKHNFLMDLNLEVFDLITRCLRMKIEYTKTTEYLHEINSNEITDFRFLANGKKDLSQFESYTQVFDDKFGFINNLSVLDLVFNEGKFALDYLKSQQLIIK